MRKKGSLVIRIFFGAFLTYEKRTSGEIEKLTCGKHTTSYSI